MTGTRVTEELAEEVKSCIIDKKNPASCIEKVFKEHGVDESDKAKVLTKILKSEIE